MTAQLLTALPTQQDVSFKLSDGFIERYKTAKPPFGFNGLGELVYLRTYSRIKEDGTQEQWFETIRRVVEGCYSMQKRWIKANHLYWNQRKAQRSAQEMYERMFTMKFLPPGRGLWAMGSPLTEERELWAALNNCAFVSTKDLKDDLAEPFCFLMDASMLGIGVGFDTKGAGQAYVHIPYREQDPADIRYHVIPDTREGWVESVRALINCFLLPNQDEVFFDYSQIRPAGTPIKGFGGVASGYEPLEKLHDALREVFDRRLEKYLTVTDIVDIMNLIGVCVVAGNVRRTAEIAFGEHDSFEFLDLKNYTENPERAAWGWTSNNSIFAKIGMDYSAVAERIAINGEPGLAWLPNMQEFSRMLERRDYKDRRALGGNPCLEQTLESYELCCLVETDPAKHETLEDWLLTLKYAYLYAKTVTLGRTPWERTNAVMLRNRRIGLSQTNIVTAMERFGMERYREMCERGYEAVDHYDEVYSDWMAVPRSIKMTSVKPSGTLSLVMGAKPGVHDIEAEYHIRRMRLSKHSSLVEPLRAAGYPVEDCVGDPSSVVVEFPVHVPSKRVASDVSMWEQLARAAFMQKHWADNQVSCTVTFHPHEAKDIPFALDYYQYQLKGISFLPRIEAGAYPQMPYEGITREEYENRTNRLRPLNFLVTSEEAQVERFCTNDTCTL